MSETQDTKETETKTSTEDTSKANLAEQELNLLKERATIMGIKFHPAIGIDTLKAKIEAQLTSGAKEDEPVPSLIARIPEMSEYQKNKNHRDDALKLVRVVVSCMNPAKQVWEGELFTVSNRVIGSVRKYVPFNNDAGYHIPNVIYQHLLDSQCQVFYTTTDPVSRQKTRKGKLVKEYNVVVLPPLTEAELKDLAMQQALNNSID